MLSEMKAVVKFEKSDVASSYRDVCYKVWASIDAIFQKKGKIMNSVDFCRKINV